MKTKFKDAIDLLSYRDRLASQIEVMQRDLADANFLVSRLTLPEDMRETPEVEWSAERFILECPGHPWHGIEVMVKEGCKARNGLVRVVPSNGPSCEGMTFMVDRLKPVPKAEPGEWIIEVTDPGIGGDRQYVKSPSSAPFDRKAALRFTSEEAANDFAADHWKGWQPKVVPFAEPAKGGE